MTPFSPEDQSSCDAAAGCQSCETDAAGDGAVLAWRFKAGLLALEELRLELISLFVAFFKS